MFELRCLVAGFYRSASAFTNLVMGALKITGEYYPGRLHKAFIVDPPSLFPYFWKVKKHNIIMVIIYLFSAMYY